MMFFERSLAKYKAVNNTDNGDKGSREAAHNLSPKSPNLEIDLLTRLKLGV
jgi:hypothetical protein